MSKAPSKPAKTAGTVHVTRRSILGSAAGALPLALSLLVGNTGKPVEPAAAHLRAARGVASSLFKPACPMPFDSDPVPEIDDECGIEGAGKTPEKIAESKAKNDFCVPTSRVTSITHQTFLDLQDSASFRKSADRGSLAKVLTEKGTAIGEGTYVEYVGYLLDAHYSNLRKGELVNCKIGGQETNDIHIELVKDPADEDACDSVTAEISPHFRPPAWTPDVLMTVQKHQLRFRGPLFYDGSHVPCRDGKRSSPARASVWEIHPVYSVDVCQLKSKSCIWIPLEQWNPVEESDETDQ